jgi:hypothetical protein
MIKCLALLPCACAAYLMVLGHMDGQPLLGAKQLAADGALDHLERGSGAGHQLTLAQQHVRLVLGLVVKGLAAGLTAVQPLRQRLSSLAAPA